MTNAMAFGIRVVNGELVRDGLERLRRNVPLISRQRIYDTTRAIARDMRIEPPPVGYARTHAYQRGWTVSKVGTNAYEVSNPVPYAQKVGGDALGFGQIHKHWPLFRSVIDKHVEKLPKSVENSIQAYAHSLNF